MCCLFFVTFSPDFFIIVTFYAELEVSHFQKLLHIFLFDGAPGVADGKGTSSWREYQGLEVQKVVEGGNEGGQDDPNEQTCAFQDILVSHESSNLAVSQFFQHLANCQKPLSATSTLHIKIILTYFFLKTVLLAESKTISWT